MEKFENLQKFLEPYGPIDRQFYKQPFAIIDKKDVSEFHIFGDIDYDRTYLNTKQTIEEFANKNASLYKKLKVSVENDVLGEFEGTAENNNLFSLVTTGKDSENNDMVLTKFLDKAIIKKELEEEKAEEGEVVKLKFNPKELVKQILHIYDNTFDENIKIEIEISNNQKKKIRKRNLNASEIIEESNEEELEQKDSQEEITANDYSALISLVRDFEMETHENISNDLDIEKNTIKLNTDNKDTFVKLLNEKDEYKCLVDKYTFIINDQEINAQDNQEQEDLGQEDLEKVSIGENYEDSDYISDEYDLQMITQEDDFFNDDLNNENEELEPVDEEEQKMISFAVGSFANIYKKATNCSDDFKDTIDIDFDNRKITIGDNGYRDFLLNEISKNISLALVFSNYQFRENIDEESVENEDTNIENEDTDIESIDSEEKDSMIDVLDDFDSEESEDIKQENDESEDKESKDVDKMIKLIEDRIDKLQKENSDYNFLNKGLFLDIDKENYIIKPIFYNVASYEFFAKAFIHNTLFIEEELNQDLKEMIEKEDIIIDFDIDNIKKCYIEESILSVKPLLENQNKNNEKIGINYVNKGENLNLVFDNVILGKKIQKQIEESIQKRLINFDIKNVNIVQGIDFSDDDIHGELNFDVESDEDLLNHAKLIYGYGTDLSNILTFGQLEGNIYNKFSKQEIMNETAITGEKRGWFKGKFLSVNDLNVFTSKAGKDYMKGSVLFVDCENHFVSAEFFTGYTEKAKSFEKIVEDIPKNSTVLVQLKLKYDDFKKSNKVTLESMYLLKEQTFEDNSGKTNRYELSTYTKMSLMDSISTPSELLELGAQYGLSGMAFTDMTSVQGFTQLIHARKDLNDFKPIFGTTFRMVPDYVTFVYNPKDEEIYNPGKEDLVYVAFDVETTGFEVRYKDLIELSAVKFTIDEKGQYKELDAISQVINVHKEIPQFIIDLTNIQQIDIDNGKELKEALLTFKEFTKDTILVGQNVKFDIDFVNENLKNNGLEEISNQVIDTLPIARKYVKTNAYNLTNLSKKFGVKLDGAHRAINDSRATGQVMVGLLNLVDNQEFCEEENQFKPFTGDMLLELGKYDESYKNGFDSEIHVLAKNMTGIKNMYKLISISATEYLTPVRTKTYERLPEHVLKENHKDILLGSGAKNSQLWKLMHEKTYDLAKEYAINMELDYIEISPYGTFDFPEQEQMFENEMLENYQNTVRLLVQLSEELSIPVVVVSSSHYNLKNDRIGYEALINYDIKATFNGSAELKSPVQLEQEFNFLDEDTKRAIIYDNTEKIANQLDGQMTPVITDVFAPKIPNADEDVREMSLKRAKELYGDPLPKEIAERIDMELEYLIKGGFTAHYIIAKKIVEYSESLGYLVGSRGSVGSSFIAYLMGITEVNALPPHYRSKYGDYFEWGDLSKYKSGYDLPKKEDPNHPGEMLVSEGENLLITAFLGNKIGAKIPDIDLNFASEIQGKAQAKIRELFGKQNTVRVGTISTVAEKTSETVVKKYNEELNKQMTEAEILYYASLVKGTKSTTGQHPAGILIVPSDKEINDFTPYTYPANKKFNDKDEENWLITHFTMDDMHDSLLKEDVLAHEDPSVLHLLQKLTGVDPKTIDPADPKVLELFTKGDVDGVPEFNTKFAKGILKSTKPTKFSHLVQISGLSHGENVWTGNAQELIEKEGKTLDDVIGSRDKITQDMLEHGLKPEDADKITLMVKKCIPFSEEDLKLMKDHGVEDWYIESLSKIRYMYPAAHAIAYVLSAVRIAYYKVYYPEAFHAAILTYRYNDCFDSDLIEDCSIETLDKKINKCQQIIKSRGMDRYNVQYKYNIDLASDEMKQKIEYHKTKTKPKGVFVWKKFSGTTQWKRTKQNIDDMVLNNNFSDNHVIKLERKESANTYEKKLACYQYIKNAILKDNIKFAKPSLYETGESKFKLNENKELIVPWSMYNEFGSKTSVAFYNKLHNLTDEEKEFFSNYQKPTEFSKQLSLGKKTLIEFAKFGFVEVDNYNNLKKAKMIFE